jgi:hypothetical protein
MGGSRNKGWLAGVVSGAGHLDELVKRMGEGAGTRGGSQASSPALAGSSSPCSGREVGGKDRGLVGPTRGRGRKRWK